METLSNLKKLYSESFTDRVANALSGKQIWHSIFLTYIARFLNFCSNKIPL